MRHGGDATPAPLQSVSACVGKVLSPVSGASVEAWSGSQTSLQSVLPMPPLSFQNPACDVREVMRHSRRQHPSNTERNRQWHRVISRRALPSCRALGAPAQRIHPATTLRACSGRSPSRVHPDSGARQWPTIATPPDFHAPRCRRIAARLQNGGGCAPDLHAVRRPAHFVRCDLHSPPEARQTLDPSEATAAARECVPV